MVLAQHFAAGVDVWINNPRRPAEACGTSGMKMLVNGGLHCSTLDGWWDEAYTPEVGWEIGGTREHSGEHDHDDACALYDLLEHVIAPEFYDRDHLGVPRAWMHRVRASMTQLTEQFSSDRMVREYVEQAYLPAARAFLRRSADGARLARELEAWSALAGRAVARGAVRSHVRARGRAAMAVRDRSLPGRGVPRIPSRCSSTPKRPARIRPPA